MKGGFILWIYIIKNLENGQPYIQLKKINEFIGIVNVLVEMKEMYYSIHLLLEKAQVVVIILKKVNILKIYLIKNLVNY